jgi:hypothetical protein
MPKSLLKSYYFSVSSLLAYNLAKSNSLVELQVESLSEQNIGTSLLFHSVEQSSVCYRWQLIEITNNDNVETSKWYINWIVWPDLMVSSMDPRELL